MSAANPVARLRGTAAGLLTAALAVAAHAAGSGALTTGAVVAQLAVLAATVGALAATISRAADARILLGLLAAGLDRNAAAGTVSSVTWTAAPGTGIAADQFALFRISVKLPDIQTVSFPATQTYSDGTVVKWDQPTPPGGAEPEYPAPEVALTGAKTDAADDRPMPVAQTTAPDNSARWRAGGALAVAAVAVATALLVRRRT